MKTSHILALLFAASVVRCEAIDLPQGPGAAEAFDAANEVAAGRAMFDGAKGGARPDETAVGASAAGLGKMKDAVAQSASAQRKPSLAARIPAAVKNAATDQRGSASTNLAMTLGGAAMWASAYLMMGVPAMIPLAFICALVGGFLLGSGVIGLLFEK